MRSLDAELWAAIDPQVEEPRRTYFFKSLKLRRAMLPYVGGYLTLSNSRTIFIEGCRCNGHGDFVIWGQAYREDREVAISDAPDNGWPLIVRNAPVECVRDPVVLMKRIFSRLPGLR